MIRNICKVVCGVNYTIISGLNAMNNYLEVKAALVPLPYGDLVEHLNARSFQ